MAFKHTVKQGEHISGIAASYGFEDYLIIWNDPGNAELQQTRDNPHALFPGDEIQIPDQKEPTFTRPTGKEHRFVLKAKRLKLRVKVLKLGGAPLAVTPCELAVDGGAAEALATDGDGLVEKEIPRAAEIAKLVVADADFSMKIGHLNPMVTGDDVADAPGNKDSGWEQRLNNLGYVVPPEDDRDPDELRSAIEEFQCDHGMKVTGEQDAATRAKLQHVHGA